MSEPAEPGLVMGLVRRVFPVTANFFELLKEQSAVSVASMERLVAYMDAGDPAIGLEIRALDRRASQVKERSMDALNAAFSTPMDREELYRAIATIHRIATYAHTTVREMDVLRVEPDEWTRAMANLLLDGAVALDEGYAVLEKEPTAAQAKADRARVAERRVEKQYRLALVELFSPGKDHLHLEGLQGPTGPEAYRLVMEVFKRREVYRHLSNAGDRVARAGDTLHDIVVKLV